MSAAREKVCAFCGRPFEWRKKWARSWDEVKFCSEACRRGVSRVGQPFEQAVLELLAARAATASICPSEVARAMNPNDWRPLMDDVRAAAVRLVTRGRIEITQGDRVVDPLTARGAIRIRLPR